MCQRGRGLFFVAFVVDVFSRRIVGWRALKTMQTDLILDALSKRFGREANPKALFTTVIVVANISLSDTVSDWLKQNLTRLSAASATLTTML